MDREKIIKGLEICTGVTDDCAGHTCPYWDHDDSEVGCRTQVELDALALLKEQEHKDKMYHALEDDWKRLKELLKEQEAVEPKTGQWIYKKYDDMFMCSSCEKYSIRNDYPYCHWCGAKMESR